MEEPVARVCDPNNLETCCPLKSFSEVLTWKEPVSPNWAKFVNPLKKRAKLCLKSYSVCGHLRRLLKSSECPKTLVCHDMKGGYINDRFVNGHNDLSDYKFLCWPCTDIFVYFSHELITIPPLTWINAGHLHGVRVLGTIITEGEEAATEWNNLCNDSYLLDRLAINLTLICKYYGFDGYLLNIENEIDPEIVKGSFIKFISTLNNNLKRLSSDKLLIWYDAVTNTGDLKWQNRLNEKNRDFFEACDGIFLNYCWDENALIESVNTAGDRKHDVYVGIDVFGRGCIGGGGFSTNEAFNLIRKHDLSAAIFAPGWVHENCGETESADSRDFIFWNLISEFLYTHGPCLLPFETSFCRGFGPKFHQNGLVVKSEPWFNQSKIDHLPTILAGLHSVEDGSCVTYYDKDGFSGGGCLLISQNLSTEGDDHIDRLLVCDFSSNPEDVMCIDIFTKPLLAEELCEMDFIVTTGIVTEDLSPEEVEEKFHCFEISESYNDERNGWNKSSFQLTIGEEHILSLGCKLKGKRKPVLIGHLRVYSNTNTL